jgi:hypothetical protein
MMHRSRVILCTSVQKTASGSVTKSPKNADLAFKWDPLGNKYHGILRDAAYIVYDTPVTLYRVNSKYGLFVKMLRNKRRGITTKPEDLQGLETHEIRHMLQVYQFIRGPFQKLDFRIFNWIYASLAVYSCFQFIRLYARKEKMLESVEMPLSERRKLYTNDYEEDVKPR